MRTRQVQPEATSPFSARRCTSRGPWRARRLLLVVDDEPQVRSLFKTVLEAEPGTRVVEAGTSEEALQLAWWMRFDLVISDINHRHMNGLELLKVLKQEQPDLRVMIVSGALNDTRWREALRLGACCGLTKPFRGSTLRGTVAVALKG